MPQFHSPDFVYLNGHASTSSMQPLMNGHLAADSADSIEGERADGAAAPLAMTCRTPSEDRDPEENEVDSDPGLFLSFRKRGLWHDRSGLEKLLAGLVILCLIGFLTVVILLATGPRDNEGASNKLGQTGAQVSQKPWVPEQTETPETCVTVGCVNAAANLLSAIDLSKDPCQDFYSYACGKWNRDNPIPDDMSSYGTFALVRERVRQQMRGGQGLIYDAMQAASGLSKSDELRRTTHFFKTKRGRKFA